MTGVARRSVAASLLTFAIALLGLLAAAHWSPAAGRNGATTSAATTFDRNYDRAPQHFIARTNDGLPIAADSTDARTPALSLLLGVGAGVAAEGAGSFADLSASGRVATEAEFRAYAESQGWTLEQSATWPAKYVDENWVPRLTMESGSSQTPGSEDPHI
jgi:hypothetical protein